MFMLRRAVLRTVTSSSRCLLSNPQMGKSISTRTAISYRQPLVTFPFQRRFNTSDATQSAEQSAEQSTEQSVEESKVEEVGEAEVESQTSQAADDARSFSSVSRTSPSIGESNTTMIYVGNIFFDVSESELRNQFAPIGPIKKVNIVQDQRGMSKGFGFIEFENQQDADRAVEVMHQVLFQGRRLAVQYHRARVSARPSRNNPPMSTLYIGNMSFELTDKDLNELFRKVGNVIDVRVAVDRRTGQPRGFAHADFADVESATKAKEFLETQELYGRRLRVDYGLSNREERDTKRRESRDSNSDGGAFH